MLALISLVRPMAIAAYAEDTTIPAETVVEEIPLSTAPAEEMQNEETEPAIEPLADDPTSPPENLQIPEDLEETSYHNIPLFFQNDYPQTIYGTGTVANNGCGITCLAMVATYLTGHPYLPDELARYFGGRAENNIARLEYGSDCLQLPYYKATNWHETLAALENGKIAIALMGNDSIFTSGQHFIVLVGMTEDGKIINHLYEFDCGVESGWMYKVNEWFPNYGCSAYELKGGEDIVWCYTCNGLGEDVGEIWMGEEAE